MKTDIQYYLERTKQSLKNCDEIEKTFSQNLKDSQSYLNKNKHL